MAQRIIPIDSPFFIHEHQAPPGADLNDFFSEKRPLALEIGCGIGDFIVQRAAQCPQFNYLAIDIYNKGCLKTCRRIESEALENIRVMRIEARYLFHHYLPAESLAAIYINCPDPWPKKRHRPRRLVGEPFLLTALYYLRPAGELYFATDFPDYASDVAEVLPTFPGYRNLQDSPLTTELPGYPVSKYMRRFLDLGQPIHFIHYAKKEASAEDPLQLPPPVSGFRLRWAEGDGA
ncbi:MAG TPA: tRNA (guanosine(46)-N7)-methyltransferase TrmB [Desulfuromonadales bacterium]|nr:tRNA (guanosine(46)-N7)-methyltransferase TrmB [Desulfuromonadales bacterium]